MGCRKTGCDGELPFRFRQVLDHQGNDSDRNPLPPSRRKRRIGLGTSDNRVHHSDGHYSDSEVRSLAREDAICRRLMTAPGVGPITAERFRAAIDDVTRFRSAHAVESYLGLVPGEHSSSDSQHRLGITKAGSTRLRTCLIQSAWCSRRCRNTPPMVRTRSAKRVASLVEQARREADRVSPHDEDK